MNLNIIDLIFLIIILCAVGAGFVRGLISEVVSLVTLIAAIFIAVTFANPVARLFTSSGSVQQVVSQSTTTMGVDTSTSVSYLALGLSFTLLFIATLMLGMIVRVLLNVAFQAGIVGVGNRIFGALFGLVKAYLYLVVIVFIVQLSPINNQSWWQSSTIVIGLQPSVQWLGSIVSPTLNSLKSKLGDTLQNVNTKLQDMTN